MPQLDTATGSEAGDRLTSCVSVICRSMGPPARPPARPGGSRHVLPVELLVRALQPAEGRLVLAVEAVVEVDKGVVALHILVQRVLEVSGQAA